MNPAPHTAVNPATSRAHAPANWREALLALVTSRLALIELEAKEAAGHVVKRVAMLAAGALCLIFTWALLVVGAVAAIAGYSGSPWHWIALGAAGLHLLVAWVLVRSASRGQRSFPVTRAEFTKDRQWIESLQTNNKFKN